MSAGEEFMAIRRKKTYQFSDELVSRDAIISMVFGFLALVGIVTSVVYSLLSKGEIIEQLGAILLASGIMALTAVIFSIIAYADTEGGVRGKKVALIVSLVDIILIATIYFFGSN